MSNILPLERWKNIPIAKCEAFYSDTDSDEKNSDYEEVVIPKVKRERDIEEENSNVKRTKLKPEIPKCIHLVQFQQTSRPKRDPGFWKVRQDLLLASLQNGSNQASRTSHLSLPEDNSRREICILMWPCDFSMWYNASTHILVFFTFLLQFRRNI